MERNVNELENKNDNDDTASDGEEREVCFKISIKIFMYDHSDNSLYLSHMTLHSHLLISKVIN